jgi:hypothetical protein
MFIQIARRTMLVVAGVLCFASSPLAQDNPVDQPHTVRLQVYKIPPLGRPIDKIKGKVYGISSNKLKNHRIAVYIKVNGQWWVKPYANHRKTSIGTDGKWVVDVTTGGIDTQLTEIAVLLIVKNTSVPTCLPCQSVPDIKVVASKRIIRRDSGQSYAGAIQSDSDSGQRSDTKVNVWVDDEGLHVDVGKYYEGAWHSAETLFEDYSVGALSGDDSQPSIHIWAGAE